MPSLALALGTLIECPATLSEPRPPLLKCMCMRCELVLGWKVCEPALAGQISHGSCPTCAAIILEEFEAWKAACAAEQLAREYSEAARGAVPSLCAPGACLDRKIAISSEGGWPGRAGDTKRADGGRIFLKS